MGEHGSDVDVTFREPPISLARIVNDGHETVTVLADIEDDIAVDIIRVFEVLAKLIEIPPSRVTRNFVPGPNLFGSTWKLNFCVIEVLARDDMHRSFSGATGLQVQPESQIRLQDTLQNAKLSTLAQADGFPAAVAGPAAIDRERMAIDETALDRVGEEGDGPGNIVGSGKAAHGHAAGDIGVGVAAAHLVGDVHLGLDPTGTDGIDTDAATAPLRGEGTGKANEPVL